MSGKQLNGTTYSGKASADLLYKQRMVYFMNKLLGLRRPLLILRPQAINKKSRAW